MTLTSFTTTKTPLCEAVIKSFDTREWTYYFSKHGFDLTSSWLRPLNKKVETNDEMASFEGYRSVSDHNSNAQTNPVESDAVRAGDDITETLNGSIHRDSRFISMPGIDGRSTEYRGKRNLESNLYEYPSDNSKTVDSDSTDESTDSGDEREGFLSDGRRSCCSLSDDTSSMSETELSQSDAELKTYREDDFDRSGHITKTGEQKSTKTANEGPSTDGQVRDRSLENNSEDTFTDLSLDSLKLSQMDSSLVESECSTIPEISKLDITDADSSFGVMDAGNSDGKMVSPKNRPESVEDCKSKESSTAEKSALDKKEQYSRKLEHPATESDSDKTDCCSNENTFDENGVSREAEERNDSHVVNGQHQVPANGGQVPNNLYSSFPYHSTVMFYPAYSVQQAQQCSVAWGHNAGPDFPVFQGQQAYYNATENQLPQFSQPQQPIGFQQYEVPCHYPVNGYDSRWQDPAPGYPPVYNGCPSAGQPFNTQGLLTAEQYYSGQETPHPQWNTPAASDVSVPPAPLSDVPGQDFHNFQYPCVYVSQAGLITVLLKNDVSVELTVDKTLRLVSHQRRLVIASNSRGSANCLYHPHAKVCHDRTTTEIELSDERKVKMSTEYILITNGNKCFRFDYNDVQEASPDFRDISKDNSVTLLFGSSGYGPSLIPKCLELAQNAVYTHNGDGSFKVRINDISIAQSNRGDVTVLCGPKFLKMAPLSSYLRLQTHFIDMAVYRNGKVFVRRGTHSLDSNPSSLHVNNGNLEVGFEDGEDLSVCRLPRRTPLSALSRRQRRKTPGPRTRQNKFNWQRQ